MGLPWAVRRASPNFLLTRPLLRRTPCSRLAPLVPHPRCTPIAPLAAPTHPSTHHTHHPVSHPNAICNDGTYSGFYYRLSPSKKSNDWLVFLEGGGWCYDEDSCAHRGDLASSKSWTPTMTQGGIFDSQDARLADANLVYLRYCSSDAYIGDLAAGASPVYPSFAFRGKAIVDATFGTLVSDYGFGAVKGSRLLWGGCSAGARGALFNYARIVSTILPGLGLTQNVTVGALFDSAFWVDIAPFGAVTTDFEEQTKAVISMSGGAATLDPACLAAYPKDTWKCAFGEYALPFASKVGRFLLHSFQQDRFQLTGDFDQPFNFIPKSASELAYVAQFANLTRVAARADIPDGSSDYVGHFPACYKHCNTQTATFSTAHTQGVTLEQHVVGWFYGTPSTPSWVEDNCAGFNCGTECPAP